MSHFYAIAVVPPGTSDVRAYIAKAMGPFSENLEVPEHDEKCHCVGEGAREDCYARTNAEFGSLPSIQVGLNRVGLSIPMARYLRCVEVYERELIAKHPMRDAARDGCDNCKGTGTYVTTANPDGFWDWYRIGGHETEGNNTSAARFLAEFERLRKPYALVLPDGSWLAKGTMYMFGQSEDRHKPADWDEKVLAALSKYSDHVLVGLDCHT